jgi:DNA-binding beta-propeller fold protein YncE
MTCEDGVAACDADASPDGECTFRLRVCFGTAAGDPRCIPTPVETYDLKRPSRRAARRRAVARANRAAILDAVGALDRPIDPAQCTGDVLIRVPLRKDGRAGKVVLRARTHAGGRPLIDPDVLRLSCRPATAAGAPQRLALILTTDFTTTGAYSTITLEPPRVVRADLGVTHSDAVGRAFRSRGYIVNRLGQDNVQIVNPTTGTSLTACSIANGANPQDIAFATKDKAYVTQLRDGIVNIVDPTVPRTCARFKRGRIDLSHLADADGSPELGRMVIVGDRLFVAALRLDRNRNFVPAARGLVAVIDTRTDALLDADPATPELDAIPLSAANPFGMVYDPGTGKVWVWESGHFSVTGDGGIEAIDPVTNRAEGFIATEADLGGSVTAVAPYSADRAFAVVANADFRNSLVAFSPTSGKRLETLRSADSFFPTVMVNDRGEVWLADRSVRAPGIRIFDADSGHAVAGPLDVGLPPFDILFVP